MKRVDIKDLETRKLIEEQAQYIVNEKATIRQTATYFFKSKTGIHKNMREKLEQINPKLYKEVVEVLEYNKSVRHIRGGETIKKIWESKEEASASPDTIIRLEGIR